MSLFLFDKTYKKNNNINLLAGVDEAGRGPLAGPVAAGCVILKEGFFNSDINDSKKLSDKKREELYDIIIENAVSYSVVFVDNFKIDEINILNATKLAMKMAVNKLIVEPEMVLVDGNFVPEIKIKCESLVKGDSKSSAIAAASILAKVERDRLMREYDLKYKEFSFKNHKGYPTKLHYDAILKYGYTEIHRKTFLKKLGDIKPYGK